MPRIIDVVDTPNTTVSFEFFPPKSVAATDRLLSEITKLDEVEPDFVSVTYGAGGTTRTRTSSIVCGLAAQKPYPVMPHLTAAGHTRADIRDVMSSYSRSGVDNLLVLAGDPPADGSAVVGDYTYASDLVEDVRSLGDFCIGVAAFPEGHPRSTSREDDRAHLARKLDQSEFGITQFFFDAKVYSEMVEDLGVLGATAPVLPGVMPIANTESTRRFAEMNGASVPEDLFAALDGAGSDEQRYEIAVDHAAQLVTDLVDAGAPGIHFYTLNRSAMVLDVIERCGLR